MTDRSTPTERAASLEHDPLRCHICLRPEIYGDFRIAARSVEVEVPKSWPNRPVRLVKAGGR